MRTSAFTSLALLLLPTACGGEQAGHVQQTSAPSTLHVRAAGMVKSLGIT